MAKVVENCSDSTPATFSKVSLLFTVFSFKLWRRVKTRKFVHFFGSVRKNAAQFLAFLLLHSAILEPDFNLRLVEVQAGGHLHSASPGQVFVEVELFLQLGQLLGGKVGSDHVVLAGDPELRQGSCGDEMDDGKCMK